jgi:DNA-directed RNA polymerase specialized sigma24 family protein
MHSVHPHPEMLQRALAGDGGALGVLLRSYHGRLFHYIERLLPAGAADAQDVLQDVFFDAFRGIGSFVAGGNDDSFYCWLRTIARHRIVDLMRRQQAVKRGGDAAEVNWRDDSVIALLEELAVYERTPSPMIITVSSDFVIWAACR